jgi:CRISPR-associated protein Cmr4
MSGFLVGMLAETFIHPGAGQSIGAIDLPVSREKVTGYPFIPGSSVKGALKAWAKERVGNVLDVPLLFGEDEAGQLLVSDARLLLLPVRSLNMPYAWLLCPLIIERILRDIGRMEAPAPFGKIDLSQLSDGHFLGACRETLGLEEREFERAGDIPQDVYDLLHPLIPDSSGDRLKAQLVILSDTDFAWFCDYGLPVLARNFLGTAKISTNLWYEQTLAPDTVMYLVIASRGAALDSLKRAMRRNRYCQFGGNETVGQGWFQFTL